MNKQKLLFEDEFYDGVVSKAYCVMFYIARAMLQSAGYNVSKHAGVIGLFGQHFSKTGKVPTEFHQYLIKAQTERHSSGYDNEAEFTKADAEEQLTRAEKFIRLGEDFLTSDGSSTVPPRED